MASSKIKVPFVLGETPKNGKEIVFYSLKKHGIDVIIPKASVEAKYTLSGYMKYTIEGQTDRGGVCKAVARTSEDNDDELQVIEVKFL